MNDDVSMRDLVEFLLRDLSSVLDQPGLASFKFSTPGQTGKVVVEFVPALEELVNSRVSWTPRELIEAIMDRFTEEETALIVRRVN
jgi:hypothetical protein